MFVTGPDVIRTVTHEEVNKEDLGGAMTHNARSGVAHFAVDDDRACLGLIRELLSYLPSNNLEEAPAAADRRPSRPRGARPRHPRSRGDREALRHEGAHRGRWSTIAASSRCTRTSPGTSWSASRASPGGASGSWPTNPRSWPAAWTSTPRSRPRASSASATPSTFPSSPSRTCPASCPAPAQEFGGIIRHGAKLLYAFAEATVPKITVITRKAYGGAYCVMASKHIRTDLNLAYPTAEIAVMGPEGAVNVLYRRELAQGRGPGRPPRGARGRVPREVREPLRRRGAGLRRRGHRARARPAARSSPASPSPATSGTRTRPRSTATSRYEGLAPIREGLPQDPDREPRRDRGAHHPRLPRDGHRPGRRALRGRPGRPSRPHGGRILPPRAPAPPASRTCGPTA